MSTATAPVESSPLVKRVGQPLWKRFLTLGSGVGIEIDGADLVVLATRVKPSGVVLLGELRIANYRARQASEWGLEYQAFLKKIGLGHVAALVLLPRHEVTLRVLNLPGVADKDLASAISFQSDSLHPYGDVDVYVSHARLEAKDSVLVAIVERERVDAHAASFAEAGIKIAGFTVSAAALYSASRLLEIPAPGLLAYDQRPLEVEMYGESESRPLFSALFDDADTRAIDRTLAELRLAGDTPLVPASQLLPVPENAASHANYGEHALLYATALASAAPARSLTLNLLPEEYRSTSSRMLYVPTIVLGSIVLAMALFLWWQQREAQRQYVELIQQETQRYQPAASRLARINKDIDTRAAQIKLLSEYRQQSRRDLDSLQEMTRLFVAPSWIMTLQMTPQEVQMMGNSPNAAELLRTLDGSEYFENSEFTMTPQRNNEVDQFSLKTRREAPKQ